MSLATELSLWRCTAKCGCTDQGPHPSCSQGAALFVSVQQCYTQTLGIPPSQEREWAEYETARAWYFLHLGMTRLWGRLRLPVGSVHTAMLYPLDDEAFHAVMTHSASCARCRAGYLRTMKGDWLVDANDLCLDIRADLERGETLPELGMAVDLPRRQDACAYDWLLARENIPELQVGVLPRRFLLLPSAEFHLTLMTDFLAVGATKAGAFISVREERGQ